MISSIERGLQDPRYSTLERILAAVDQEIDVIDRAGRGVDRITEQLGRITLGLDSQNPF